MLIWKRRRSTSLTSGQFDTQEGDWQDRQCSYKGYVHVWATAPEIAPASNLRIELGVFSPSGVRNDRTDSYVIKFKPTCSGLVKDAGNGKGGIHMGRHRQLSGLYHDTVRQCLPLACISKPWFETSREVFRWCPGALARQTRQIE